MLGTCLTFLLALTSNSEYPPTFVSELPIVVMGIGWTQAEQAEAVRAFLLRHPPPNSKLTSQVIIISASQPWLYTDPAVAVSRGLLAPANFLIDVMRGAPSLSQTFLIRAPHLCRFESCFLHHFYTLQTSKKLSSRQGCPHPDGPVCWDGTVRGWVRVWQPQQPAV